MENLMYIIFIISIMIITVGCIISIQKNKTEEHHSQPCYNFRRINKELDEYIAIFFKQRISVEQIKSGGNLKTLSIEKNVKALCYDITMNVSKALLYTEFYNTISMYINKSDITDVIYGKVYDLMKGLIVLRQKEIYGDR